MRKFNVRLLVVILVILAATVDVTANPPFKVFNSSTWYVMGRTTGKGVFFMKTTDGGYHWDKYTNILNDTSAYFLSMSFINQSTGFASGSRTGIIGGWMARTTNGGLKWDTLQQPTGYPKTVICFYNINMGFTADSWYGQPFTNNSIWRTTNGGLNWISAGLWLNTNLTRAFYWDSLHASMGANHGGAYFYTSNAGVVWQGADVPYTNSNMYDMTILDYGEGLAVTDIPWEVHATTNRGVNWSEGSLFTSISSTSSVRGDSLNYYIVGDSSAFMRSTNAGLTFSKLYYNIPGPAKSLNLEKLHDTLFIQRSDGNFYKSNNKGLNWVSITPAITNYSSVSGIVRYGDNGQVVTSGTVKAFKLDAQLNIIVLDSAHIQSNGAYTLPRVPVDTCYIGVYPNSNPVRDYIVTNYPSTPFWRFAVRLYTGENLFNINIGVIRLYANSYGNSVNGKVMSAAKTITGIKDAVLLAKKDTSYVGCGVSDANGVYHIQGGLPAGQVKIFADRLGYFGDSTTVTLTSTSNLDSVNFHLNKVPVGIRIISAEIPESSLLYQNYPNPFNPVTKIGFDLQKNGFVSLTVYDITGKESAVLINREMQPGRYEVEFDGSSLPSGVYFYRLKSVHFSDTKRMLLLK